MKRKKSKHFSTRKELLDAIDDKTHFIGIAQKLADKYDGEADELIKWFAITPIESIKTEAQRTEWHGKYKRLEICRTESGVKRRSIPRLNNELHRLKLALAEFDTIPMPFLKGSEGVMVNL